MFESTVKDWCCRVTARASLAVLGVKLAQLDFFAPLYALVHIAQKQVRYHPVQKLCQLLVAILAGAAGTVEVNRRLRTDPALQVAFGLTGCADQSVLQDTLNAATPQNVTELEAAAAQIFRQHSRTARHRADQGLLVLDVDLTGLPCGKKAAFATKGYFEHQRNRRGRQLGRVFSAAYDEIVTDQLFPGNQQLSTALSPLIEAAERVLDLRPEQRAGILLRLDAGAGTVGNLNWVLERGYHYHGKDYFHPRVQALCRSIPVWYADPQLPGREFGWITEASPYQRMVYRIGVRCRDPHQPDAPWKYAVLLSTLDPRRMVAQMGAGYDTSPTSTLAAYVHFYDRRGGGVETSFKAGKQALQITHRNKKRFPGQQMLVLLEMLAYNVWTWARRWLAPLAPRISRWGLLRCVRDLGTILGAVTVDAEGRVRGILLNEADALAREALQAFEALLAPSEVTVQLSSL